MLAGAIALGEAGDEERHAYRGHLSTCPKCVAQIGGEREIERVIDAVAQARDQERWDPKTRTIFARARGRRYAWRWAASLCAAVLALVAMRAIQADRPVVVQGMAGQAQRSVATAQEVRGIAALGTQALRSREQRAESLAIGAAAGSRGATVTLSVHIDEQGRATRCSVVKRSAVPPVVADFCAAVLQTNAVMRTK
jgi:hypothetical protein